MADVQPRASHPTHLALERYVGRLAQARAQMDDELTTLLAATPDR